MWSYRDEFSLNHLRREDLHTCYSFAISEKGENRKKIILVKCISAINCGDNNSKNIFVVVYCLCLTNSPSQSPTNNQHNNIINKCVCQHYQKKKCKG